LQLSLSQGCYIHHHSLGLIVYTDLLGAKMHCQEVVFRGLILKLRAIDLHLNFLVESLMMMCVGCNEQLQYLALFRFFLQLVYHFASKTLLPLPTQVIQVGFAYTKVLLQGFKGNKEGYFPFFDLSQAARTFI